MRVVLGYLFNLVLSPGSGLSFLFAYLFFLGIFLIFDPCCLSLLCPRHRVQEVHWWHCSVTVGLQGILDHLRVVWIVFLVFATMIVIRSAARH